MQETKKPIWMIVAMIIIIGIIIGGIYYWQNQNDKGEQDNPKSQTTTTSPTNSAGMTTTTPTNTTIVGTEDWQTYTSSSDNYSIKYPKSWIYDSPSAGSIVFRGEADGQWLFQVSAATTNKTLQQNVDTEKTSNTNNGCTVKTSDVTIGGQSAVKLSLACEGGYGDTKTLVVYGGKLYTLSQGVGTDQDESNMVKTFQFIK